METMSPRIRDAGVCAWAGPPATTHRQRNSKTNERMRPMVLELQLSGNWFDDRLGREFASQLALHGWNEPVLANRHPCRRQAAVRLPGCSEQHVRAWLHHGAVAGLEGDDGDAGGDDDDFFSVLVAQRHPPARTDSD